jgi:hypothetical protein
MLQEQLAKSPRNGLGCEFHGGKFKNILELVIDSRIVVDGSVSEYRDNIVGFSHGFDLVVTLALGFSQK